MKKVFISISCVMLLLIPLGCSQQTDKKTESTKTEQTTITKTKAQTIHGMSMKMTDFTPIASGTKEDQKILKVSVRLKNETATPLNYDSLGLEIYNKKGEKLTWYPSTNFGGVLAPQQEITGDSFYEAKGEGPYTIKYRDLDKPKDSIEWKNISLK
ncbi:DUF4352 domain-containing protein [Listeria booriae]|uniref:DUF4352 domain-containing protein n=1 Tax=Listeria booriae TaxID=1552123 RepID=UPI001627FE97|nr:DUF4352 domain-containing protein [Listeria booriae]MBC1357951.1 DUF4352 domain-containing protein [Listeria booriae]